MEPVSDLTVRGTHSCEKGSSPRLALACGCEGLRSVRSPMSLTPSRGPHERQVLSQPSRVHRDEGPDVLQVGDRAGENKESSGV